MVSARSVTDDAYLRTAEAIYARSREMATAEADLTGIPAELHDPVLWLVHAVGDPGLSVSLRWSGDLLAAGITALQTGAIILTDSRMVAAGIDRTRLPADNTVLCTLGLGGLHGAAQRTGATRSAAAVDRWRPWLAGAVVAIGNAPTALFRLLELLQGGAPRPAVVLGFPVGFVGAAEAKDALAATKELPYLTARGRRGGSAMAVAAVNALSRAAAR